MSEIVFFGTLPKKGIDGLHFRQEPIDNLPNQIGEILKDSTSSRFLINTDGVPRGDLAKVVRTVDEQLGPDARKFLGLVTNFDLSEIAQHVLNGHFSGIKNLPTIMSAIHPRFAHWVSNFANGYGRDVIFHRGDVAHKYMSGLQTEIENVVGRERLWLQTVGVLGMDEVLNAVLANLVGVVVSSDLSLILGLLDKGNPLLQIEYSGLESAIPEQWRLSPNDLHVVNAVIGGGEISEVQLGVFVTNMTALGALG